MILDPAIFFKGDIIDLSFVCNNGQIDNLLSQIETSLIERIFEEIGEIETPPQQQLVDVLKYFAFIEMLVAITNDFSANYVKSYYAQILQANPTLAFEMVRNKIAQAKVHAYSQVLIFNLVGWKIFQSYYEISNYL